MKHRINAASITLRMAALLICLVLLTGNLLSDIMARFTTSDESRDSARVAGFVFSVNNAENNSFDLDLSHIKHPGTYQDFTFTVSNQKGNIVSEVAESVTANIKTEGEIPLVITLSVNSDTHTFTVVENTELFSADIASFAAGAEASQSFTLRVEWPRTQNSIDLMNKPMEITLSLTAEQID